MVHGKKIKMFSTRTSQVVPHLSTNRACPCLTSQIRRDAVLSRKYGRTWNDLTRRATCSKKQRDSDGERNLWLGPTTIHRLPPAAWQLRHILMQSVCPWRPCDDRQAALAMPHTSQSNEISGRNRREGASASIAERLRHRELANDKVYTQCGM
jgi:hypothetical protein